MGRRHVGPAERLGNGSDLLEAEPFVEPVRALVFLEHLEPDALVAGIAQAAGEPAGECCPQSTAPAVRVDVEPGEERVRVVGVGFVVPCRAAVREPEQFPIDDADEEDSVSAVDLPNLRFERFWLVPFVDDGVDSLGVEQFVVGGVPRGAGDRRDTLGVVGGGVANPHTPSQMVLPERGCLLLLRTDASLICGWCQFSTVTRSPRFLFWLALAWLGLVQTVDWSLAILEIGLWPGNVAALAGSLLLVVVSAVGLRRPDLLSGPTERNALWWGAVAAAGLGTVVLLL